MKILVVSPTPTHPQNAGNRARIHNLLMTLKDLGNEIHLLYYDREYNHSHIKKRPDVNAMVACWDLVHYVSEHSFDVEVIFTKIGINKIGRSIIGKLWWLNKIGYFLFGKLWWLNKIGYFLIGKLWWLNKIGYFVIGKLWWLNKIGYFVKGNVWRITHFLNFVLRIPDRVLHLNGMILRGIWPSLYWKLKPRFPDKTGLPLDRFKKNQLQITIPDRSINGINENSNDRFGHGNGEFTQIDEWYNPVIDKIVRKLHKKHGYDAVIAEYVFMSKVLTNFDGNVLKVIDTHDVFTNRNIQFEENGIIENFFNTTRIEEAKGLRRADKIISIQDEERAFFKTLVNREIITIGHTVELKKPEKRKSLNKNILFLGTGNSGNIHGIQWFIENVLPLIKVKEKDFKLILAGHICNFVDKNADVIMVGEVKDKKTAYQMSDIVINPNFVGSGLKIKSIEALGQGKILIGTPHAGKGLSINRTKSYIEVNTPAEFANAILNIMTNVRLYNRLIEEAYEFVKNYNENTIKKTAYLFSKPVERNHMVQQSRLLKTPGKVGLYSFLHSKRKITKFIICTFSRTGSTTLAQLLEIHGSIKCLHEPFNIQRGIDWGNKNYRKKVSDKISLYKTLHDIYSDYTGIKHLSDQLPFELNEKLLQFNDCNIIFLWRRNFLQRLISYKISYISGHWGNDRSKIINAAYEPLDLRLIAKRLKHDKRQLKKYQTLCRTFGDKCFELTYEDIFGLGLSFEEKSNKLIKISDFLGIGTQWVAQNRKKIESLLDPSVTKLNSVETYGLIPNISEIEQEFGSPENGFLYK
jgi:polysaccharide biosynthesis protein PslH